VLAEIRAVRATVLRLYEESGASDFSDVRRFNEAIDEALTESMDRCAVQTDLFRDQFIGVPSYDLRTPLAAITVGAPLLAAPEDNPQRRSRVVARIINSAQRMGRMIGDLLDLTRARFTTTPRLSRHSSPLPQMATHPSQRDDDLDGMVRMRGHDALSSGGEKEAAFPHVPAWNTQPAIGVRVWLV
jgi:signal transduction histidine kinase